MSCPATEGRLVLAALLCIGWLLVSRQSGSHRVLVGEGWEPYVFAFHDGDEIGPRMPARVAFTLVTTLIVPRDRQEGGIRSKSPRRKERPGPDSNRRLTVLQTVA